jgi:hypothetical protein
MGFEEEAEKSFFGAAEDAGEERGGVARNALQDVRGALGYAGVAIPKEFDEPGGQTGLRFNQGDYLRDTAERESVFALSEKSAEVSLGRHGGRT